ncbi:MAG TPA: asparagine synthase (glutamine-hydrolyzing) [Sulfurospirillum arcachonense]|nr:asparagine synthase (glutamine-hydrolyzing) [Sulfurospirillum arcachonense]
MCGISGFIDFKGNSNEVILKNMTDVIHHRGPDDSGYSLHHLSPNKTTIGLGHRRLSILDLSKYGHQPMSFEDIEIVYNGEVYNFAEIKEELLAYNYHFESHSDTEVILKAYHKWGLEAVHKFNGMFAITIYDKVKNKVFIIRDRSGIKPLFWYKKEDIILYASELKSFHQHPQFQKVLNTNSLALFLQYQYIPEPHSIFENCFKLQAGHYLEIDLKSKEINQHKYWDVIDAYNKPKLDISEDEAVQKTEEILTSAFNYRMVSDVPVGIFLSGGYDSSLVTALLQKDSSQKLKTFTIGFHEKGYDETPYAREVAKHVGTDHTEYYCTQKDALEIIPKLAEIYDEPFSDDSAIPTTLVSQLARKDVTVALSADGGDELFAGYNKYSLSQQYHKTFSKIPQLARSPLSSLMGKIDPSQIPIAKNSDNFTTKYEKAKNILTAKNCVGVMQNVAHQITDHELRKIIKNDFALPLTNFDATPQLSESNDNLNSMLAIDYKTYMLDDILTKVDRATMSVSLEGREPLLDYRIIEFVATLPSHYKYKNGVSKHILKEITHKYIPKKMMDRPKMGFGVPLMEWFKDELKEYFLVYLDENRLEQEGIFNAKEVVLMRDRYLRGDRVSIETLWSLLVFQMWYEKWM